ncbi:MAG TPA: hypothetical protein VN823_15655 [Stellaceae bacterium]|nr:hypothetical protein [Stellaceae bacterium]
MTFLRIQSQSLATLAAAALGTAILVAAPVSLGASGLGVHQAFAKSDGGSEGAGADKGGADKGSGSADRGADSGSADKGSADKGSADAGTADSSLR